jgi:hypothetical protein
MRRVLPQSAHTENPVYEKSSQAFVVLRESFWVCRRANAVSVVDHEGVDHDPPAAIRLVPADRPPETP